MKKFRHRVYTFLEPHIVETKAEKYFDLFIVILIILNILSLMINTVQGINDQFGSISLLLRMPL